MTSTLMDLREWLLSEHCTHIAMESTGIYWRPIYALFEDAFDVTVGNAQHIKNVPGRKTDTKDAEWIADLTRHGLIRKSFVPPKPIRDLRDIVRYRRKVVQTRSSERNRLIKLLETVNIKLSNVISNVFGVSGRAMLRALLDGEMTIEEIAKLARGRMRNKVQDITLALDGKLEDHHRFVLRMQLDRVERADADVALLDARIDALLEPYRAQAAQIDQIPGFDRAGAAALIAEIGINMDAFNGPAHLASWAAVCPGNHESAGKRRKGTKRKGNVHLTTTLVEAAQAAIRKKGSYFREKFHRLKARRGYKRAIVAIAHKLLIAAYYLLQRAADYKDLGEGYLDRITRARTTRTLVRRLEMLGYDVQLTAAP